ncbi:hypothetical protein PR048_007295 [Dryococelus australis]|uniref:Uncharacterized protein n=1 Tax=Dryococelus australis TaxID=614101 RepID=A0ABQ9IDD6_9NEOP|nr:hypothetical protein PR048_007295 [Dryococelus australis]
MTPSPNDGWNEFPDVAALDILMCVQVRCLVYETPLESEEDLAARNLAACLEVLQIHCVFYRVHDNIVAALTHAAARRTSL